MSYVVLNENGDVTLKVSFEGEAEGTYRMYTYKWNSDNEYKMTSSQYNSKNESTGCLSFNPPIPIIRSQGNDTCSLLNVYIFDITRPFTQI